MDIPILTGILKANDRVAREVRESLNAQGVNSVNVMASPGAGKTSVILKSCQRLPWRSGVIEGDVAGSIDAELLKKHGVPVVQINTGGACHLEASSVESALEHLPLENLDLVWVENVGNLICPVSYDLGTSLRVVVASVPEGHDKPRKYPAVFAKSDAVLLNKMDLAELLEFDRSAFREGVRALSTETPIFEVSCKTGEGFPEWIEWLSSRLNP